MSGPGPLWFRTTDADETRALAAALARLCRPGDVLLLAGGLGAGKTTFAQGFGAGLGVAEPITSPTFTLVREYPIGGHRIDGQPIGPDPIHGRPIDAHPTDRCPVTTFLHADVYRLDHLQEVVDLGLGERVGDDSVALVEWGDVVEPVLGEGALTVRLEPDRDHDDHRRIAVGPVGGTWSGRWAALERELARWRWER